MNDVQPTDFEDIFNRDILANDDDIDILKSAYPALSNFLPWPELVTEFHQYERAATEFKKKTIRNGRVAVWCGFTAVAIVASYPIVTHLVQAARPTMDNENTKLLLTVIEILFRYSWLAALLIGSTAASQSLFVKRRRHNWLKSRVYAERLRQLFFQHLIVWFQYIASENTEDRAMALATRKEALATLKDKYGPSSGASVQQMIDDDHHGQWQIAKIPRIQAPPVGKIDPTAAFGLMKYILERRLEFQERHASRQLEDDRTPSFVSPAFKLARHNRLLVGLTAAFLVFQLLTGFLFFLDDMPSLGQTVYSSSFSIQLIVLVLQGAAIMCAGLVVATKAIEEGLNLRSDVLRYRTYRGMLQRIRNVIGTQDVLNRSKCTSIQVRLMMAEELSYWEMREFTLLHSEAAFVT